MVKLDELLKKYYFEYIKLVNIEGRAIPSIYDSLKIVQRRTLLSAYKIASNNTVKSARIVGHCIGNYHPHGDAPVYGALVGLVRSGLLQGRGNFGSNSGLTPIEPAAMRYTEAKLSEFTKYIAFRYIKYAPHYRNELNIDEPLYLPTMLPLNLIQLNYSSDFSVGIGVGVVSVLPLFKLVDLVKYILHLIENKKTPKHIPTVYRNISSRFNTTKTGNQTVIFKANYELIDDNIHVYDLPPMIGVSLNKIIKDTKYIDASKDTTHIIFLTDNENDITAIKEKQIKFTMLFEYNKKLIYSSLHNLLQFTYDNYRRTVLNKLNADLKVVDNKLVDYNIIDKMRDDINTYITLPKKKLFTMIKRNFNVNDDVVHRVMQYSIGQFYDIKQLIKDTKKERKLIKQNIDHIDEYCYNEYQNLLT